ncbi:MAG: DUF4442 domain-containing protein [Thermoanaerobaculales bacterium]|nr:DUF4442 domain-containing protein [Thermoanaerobaculales bacterium]
MSAFPFQSLIRRLPERTRANLFLRVFALTKIRMISWTGARIFEIDDHHCVVRIPFRSRNKNHLKSMYFGALMVGADLAGGLMVFNKVHASGRKVSFAFKNAHGEFLKRAEGDTYFSCQDGQAVSAALQETFDSSERINLPIHVTATVPSKFGEDPVARFDLTLSVKAV